ncbi:DNA topoisomerase IV subunit B [Brevifollis gellanilyticus]|uniref:DNA topoisomerase (ATP-hydrolyzing) n=1 Tax=Brevifollis gellanilyticus TaxID=748831 RepID=A0A512M3F5_9BACT|nr:DNA topoisomerase IV subunit B [Brevifollis gellanilyticus]GEP41270.1 DNA topoisomerase (ATP-hydrolyzing) [Brevifollis gellanilyticus]
MATPAHNYTEDSIKSLDWRQHIRLRPGMYIGKLGDGSQPEDGIYVLLKEVVDNCIDEHVMGFGKLIEIEVSEENLVTIRDYGRGVPLGKLLECAAQINTGAKYDSEVFKRSVGLNGVGIKAVNALSEFFEIKAVREKLTRAIEFCRGEVKYDMGKPKASEEADGTRISFRPDPTSFSPKVKYNLDFIREMLRYYAWLNPGLVLKLNGETFKSKDGLRDLIAAKLTESPQYPVIHLDGTDVEVAFTHGTGYGEEFYTFVNGQHTTQGGTHMAAFREAVVQECREFFKKQFEPSDVRTGIIAAVSVKVQEPVFESQTKTKLGSTHMEPNGRNLRTHIINTVAKELDNFLHKNAEVAKSLQEKILANEKERKEISGIQKAARENARKAKVHNKKLRDCRIHLDTKDKRREESTIFITEGDSASGSITKSRDVETQAVFSLRGKPLNCYGMTKKVVYENEEFYLLANALQIDEDVEDLRFNKIVLATDADVDGMHIRLLMITWFLQFFPQLARDPGVNEGHLYILQTPLFRVRNKKETFYCYSDEERQRAIHRCGKNAEITRFKGLGEISPDEFKHFIGPNMRLEPVIRPHFASPVAHTEAEGEVEGAAPNNFISRYKNMKDFLSYYMGKNTPERQTDIVANLRIEKELEFKEEAALPEAA